MKTAKQKIACCILLSMILSVALNNSVFSNTTPDLKEFAIKVKATNKGVKLTGLKGCAFKDIEFTLEDDIIQAVNQNGLTSLEEHTKITDDNSVDFLFTIRKAQDGFVLEGKKGTAWIKLGFNRTGIIDQYGMTTK